LTIPGKPPKRKSIIPRRNWFFNAAQSGRRPQPGLRSFMMHKEYDEELLLFSSNFLKQKEYWSQKLSGDIDKTEILPDLNKDISAGNGERNRWEICIPPAVLAALLKMSNNSGLSVYIILLTCLKILIFRYTNNRDISIISPVCKLKISEETINSWLFIRERLEPRMTFKELLLKIRETTLEAYENQDYPFEKLVEFLLNSSEPAGDPGISNISCSLRNIHDDRDIQGLRSSLDFSFEMEENQVNCTILYAPELYSEYFVRQLGEHFLRIIVQALEDFHIEIGQISLLSEAERKHLLSDLNAAEKDYPQNKTIAVLFESQVEKTPGNIAVVGPGPGEYTGDHGYRSLNYRQLNDKSNQLACLLRKKGVKTDTIVGIMVEPSTAMAVGMMGILKAGGAFLPISPNYPADRVQYILGDSQVHILLTQEHPEEKPGLEIQILNIDDNTLYKGEEPVLRQDHIASPSSLIYMIYTSGTTGKPKGVLINNENLVNYVSWFIQAFHLTGTDKAILTSSFAFDLGYTSFFTSILSGGELHLIAEEVYFSPETLWDYIGTYEVSFIKLTPTLFNLLVYSHGLSAEVCRSLRLVVLGGEPINPKDVERLHEIGPHIEFVNHYGPTETTIGSIARAIDFNTFAAYRSRPTIGKPISNTRVYILDENFRLLPPGVPGELCIGGSGVGRGYLNHPELTAEKFDHDLWDFQDYQDKKEKKSYQKFFGGSRGAILQKSPPGGRRLYKTGDLARWLLQGNIEFLGRIDKQIKIRGYRVELGEIENQLIKHNDIKEALVIYVKADGKDGENQDQCLYAYIVPDKNRAGKFTLEELREWLALELPDYMIPAYFFTLAEIPLTPNGKVDYRALPDKDEDSLALNTEYIAPRTEIEEKLIGIWKNVLGKDQIGINENFFMIGGDSIKSIQIASQMNTAGYKVEMKDIFRYPTIARLAPVVKHAEPMADQAVVTGPVPLTPVQRYFFESPKKEHHHYNHAVMLYSREPLEEGGIKAVFKKIQVHHDALRMTFMKKNGEIIQTNHGLEYPISIDVYDIKNQENALEELGRRANELQTSIVLEKGPLMKVGLFHLDDGDRLLIVCHHLVIDTVSWRILFEDIETLYRQYQQLEPLSLPLKSDSFKLWAEKLYQYAHSEKFLKEKAYWEQLESMQIPPLEKNSDDGHNYFKDAHTHSFSLSQEETGLFLTKVHEPFATEANDILLTALGLTIKKIYGNINLLITLEGHGREEIIEGINIGRTVGWFTSIFPVVLDLSYENDLSRQIKEVKERLHQIPHKGIGYGILKYLTANEFKAKSKFKLIPQISFNYLGQFDQDVEHVEKMSFKIAQEPVGECSCPLGKRDYEFSISGIIVNRQLEMSITYNKNHYQAETIQQLWKRYRSELLHVISYCSNLPERELTPSDFLYKNLSIDQLDSLFDKIEESGRDELCRKNIKNIYPLTPMQEGMFFHMLYDPTSPAYHVQFSFRLRGNLDPVILEKSLNDLFKRYDILRTVFIQTDDKPVQVILKERSSHFYYEDISRRKDKEEYIINYKKRDRQDLFDLSQDVLMRLGVLRLKETEYEFVWTNHHILTDGWCRGILITEFFEMYNSYMENKAPRLPVVKPYQTYIEWLQRKEEKEPKNYWARYLEDYEQLATLPKYTLPRRDGRDKQGYRNERALFTLAREKTRLVEAFAGRNQVTMNIIIQAVWGIILGRYNNTRDVVFGAVVSGRPSEMEGVDSIVGLFLNTIPVRIQYEKDMTFRDLLHQVKENTINSEPYHHFPLAQIQSQSLLKQNLLDHILVFENYPISEQIEELRVRGKGNIKGVTLELSNIETFEQTNYDFNIGILLGNEFTFDFIYNGNLYTKEMVKRIALHFQNVIEQGLGDEKLKIQDITLLSEEEKKQVLYDFNDTRTKYPKDRTVHELFGERAGRTPYHIAVVGSGAVTHVTYRELDKKSHQLAHILRARGIQADTIVGIMVERSIEMVVSILAVLKSGAAYLPLDPGYPGERIRYMLADSGAKVLVTTGNLAEEGGKVRRWEGEIYYIEEFIYSSYPLTLLPPYLQSPSNLAYVIYTSGSSGKPKGVLVEHHNIARLVKNVNFIDLKEDDRLALTGAFVFDIITFEIWGPLLNGLSLYLVSQDILLSNQKLGSCLVKNDISILHLTPQLFNQLAEQKIEIFGHLRYFLVGGDLVTPHYINQLREKYEDITILHMYGPTENTTFSTFFPVDDRYENKIPIGRPISNSSVYVLDQNLNLQPIGVVGELCVGGEGLTRGYLNRVELTNEKFIKIEVEVYSPISNMSHMSYIYKTGDLARWSLEGNLDFLGRMDQQVKVRGFRIELAEIENQLLENEEIKEAVVLAFDDTNEKYLCAYIVSEGKFSVSQLREELEKKLPHYMTPSYFMRIEEIPLTPNGKIDRRALPDPRGIKSDVDTEYVEPRNEVEKALVESWQDVLDRDIVGINENFFMIGGDSIKAIQIAARMNKAGYKIEIRELFQHPSIAELSPLVEKIKRIPDQKPVTGIIPLTPIQKWFFETKLSWKHHFNQAMMLYSKESIELEAINAVFSKIQEHHDVLRMTYKEENGVVTQTIHGLDYPLFCREFDFRNCENAREVLQRKADEIQASLDLETGPLMKITLFHLDDGDRLLIASHHLVIDGVSWRILFEDIGSLYRQYKKGNGLSLPLKTDSFKAWSDKLSQYANSESFLKEKIYWQGLESKGVPRVKRDFETNGNYIKDTHRISFNLSKDDTGLLLTKVNEPFNTEINDILLTALGLSIKKIYGNEQLLIAVEGHGREEILTDIDVSRTLGWFTCVYPLILDFSFDNDLSRQIKETKESIRRIPNKGIGYGILKYLTAASHKKEIHFKLSPQISFNYLGQLDSDVGDMPFEIARESPGTMQCKEETRNYDWEISGIILNEQLVISITYSKRQYKAETIQTLWNSFQAELNRVILECTSRKEKDLTPADLTYKELPIEVLEELKKKYPIEDIYPPSPMQEGILFSTLYEKDTYEKEISVYLTQYSFRLNSELNIYYVEKSINELLKRYDILRAIFVYEGLDRPIQIILKERKIDLYYQDIHGMPGDSRLRHIEDFKKKDRQRPYNISRDVLVRIAIFKLEQSTYDFIWNLHHILMDGWSLGILILEFFEIYSNFLENRPHRLPQVKPYRVFIEWLEKQNKEESRKYWMKYLGGYEELASISGQRGLNIDEVGFRKKKFTFFIKEEDRTKLDELAGINQVTINTVFQAIWGILLGNYNNQQDVVFGVVVSIRPSEIEGVEQMMGIFINTIPVRIRYQNHMKFSELLQKLQQEAIDSNFHHHYPLAEIQAESTLKQNLLDHILGFENYPIAEKLLAQMERRKSAPQKVTWDFSDMESYDRTNYDFAVVVVLGERLQVSFEYNANRYEKESVQRIALHFKRLLRQILDKEEVYINELKLLSAEEKNQLVKRIRNKKGKSFNNYEEVIREEAKNLTADFDY
jgi:amino acid adenylation domain-containing protein/non-ribosomal peptide synthase protein (TIGR01720 family)